MKEGRKSGLRSEVGEKCSVSPFKPKSYDFPNIIHSLIYLPTYAHTYAHLHTHIPYLPKSTPHLTSPPGRCQWPSC